MRKIKKSFFICPLMSFFIFMNAYGDVDWALLKSVYGDGDGLTAQAIISEVNNRRSDGMQFENEVGQFKSCMAYSIGENGESFKNVYDDFVPIIKWVDMLYMAKTDYEETQQLEDRFYTLLNENIDKPTVILTHLLVDLLHRSKLNNAVLNEQKVELYIHKTFKDIRFKAEISKEQKEVFICNLKSYLFGRCFKLNDIYNKHFVNAKMQWLKQQYIQKRKEQQISDSKK